MVEGWQGSGYRTRTVFGNAFQQCGASFNPARAFLHVLFYWKGDLVSSLSSRTELPASRSRNSQVPAPPCGGRTNPLRVGERDAESTLVSEQPARFSPDHVFPRVSVHIERGIRVPDPSRAISSDNRVPSSSCRRRLLLLWWPCVPGGRKDGTSNRRISVRFRFCPGRTQRPLLLSVRIHHVHSPVVTALSNPWYRCTRCFRRRPFGQPRQHRDAG